MSHEPLCLVTGATGAIGGAVAKNLAQDRHVIAIGRNHDRLAELGRHPRIRTRVVDLLEAGAIAKLIAEFDHLEILVHCAAVANVGRLDALSSTQLRDDMEINLIVPAELTRAALPLLRRARGTVVFVNSGAGLRAIAEYGAYAATKHALNAYADSLRAEESRYGVRVSSIYPGEVDTPMLAAIKRELDRDYNPEDYLQVQSVAAAVRFACDAGDDAQVTQLHVRPRRENG